MEKIENGVICVACTKMREAYLFTPSQLKRGCPRCRTCCRALGAKVMNVSARKRNSKLNATIMFHSKK